MKIRIAKKAAIWGAVLAAQAADAIDLTWDDPRRFSYRFA